MTRPEDYYRDMERVWSAIVVLGSMVGVMLIVLVSHLIFGGGR